MKQNKWKMNKSITMFQCLVRFFLEEINLRESDAYCKVGKACIEFSQELSELLDDEKITAFETYCNMRADMYINIISFYIFTAIYDYACNIKKWKDFLRIRHINCKKQYADDARVCEKLEQEFLAQLNQQEREKYYQYKTEDEKRFEIECGIYSRRVFAMLKDCEKYFFE